MKKIINIAALLFLLNVFPEYRVDAQRATVSLQIFYDELSPYGNWVSDPEYGYAWIPNAVEGFYPYGTAGYWVSSDQGWFWISDYSWGWAPFHYGRWYYDPSYAWIWVPGLEWAPAWVTWRKAEGYYGWAPVPPGFNFSEGFTYPSEQWVFVHAGDFCRRDLPKYYVDRKENGGIISRSTVISEQYEDTQTHSRSYKGPRHEDVEKSTGKKVQSYTIQESDKPGLKVEGRNLDVYRPKIEAGENNAERPAPAKVSDRKDLKTSSENKSGAKQENEVPNDQDIQKNEPSPVAGPEKKTGSSTSNNTRSAKPLIREVRSLPQEKIQSNDPGRSAEHPDIPQPLHQQKIVPGKKKII